MITPKELREKADKLFFKIAAAHLRGETIFPLVIPSNKQISGMNFSEWKNDLVPLYQGSKQAKGIGYSVDWREKKINGSVQNVPSKIYFSSLEDYLHFTSRKADFETIKNAEKGLVATFPQLADWATHHPARLLEYAAVWPELIRVCQYFCHHQPPHPFYLRELPIDVHTKFIEGHAGILRKLLDQLLPLQWIQQGESDFVSRYGIRKTSVYTQIRILDDELKPFLGYDECLLRLDDAAWLQWMPEKVFVIENEICFLTFPKVKGAVAIFGEGFKSSITQYLPWLAQTTLYCWFDLDAAGFEMLNGMRTYYPQTKSFLMDRPTYQKFAPFSVENKNKKKELPNLHFEEMEFYEWLVQQSKRLEQERISQAYVRERLSDIP